MSRRKQMNSLILERRREKQTKRWQWYKAIDNSCCAGVFNFLAFSYKSNKKPIQFQFATSDCRISVEWRLGWLAASWKLAGWLNCLVGRFGFWVKQYLMRKNYIYILKWSICISKFLVTNLGFHFLVLEHC